MEITGWILFVFGCIRLLVALANYLSRPYLDNSLSISMARKVSVLVPARNEQHNISNLLENFAKWRSEISELIIYDDLSTDATYQTVLNYSLWDPKIKVLKGEELPHGWLGKNHACDKLSKHASGDILLFIDADVTIEKDAITSAVRYMETYRLDLLSVFPTQLMENMGSLLSVPLMNWILLSLLPLPAIRKAKYPSLAAANGQFMMFDTERYQRLNPHNFFRSNPVEDIAIIKHYKRQGLNAATLLGGKAVFCQMYCGLKDALSGFSKNIIDFFGGSPVVCWLFILSTTLAPFWICVYNGVTAAILYASIVILSRVFISAASFQNIVLNIVLIIPQQMVLWIIALKATFKSKRKKLEWKGRYIS